MKPFDRWNWNRNAYHFFYRKGGHFKEMSIITILDVDVDGRIQYHFDTDEYYLSMKDSQKNFTVKIETIRDRRPEWTDLDDDSYEFFELEVAELTHFI